MSYGTLAAKPELREDWPWHYRFIGDPPPTRPEEYHFVLTEASKFKARAVALDAACGWRPDWHILGHNFVHHHQVPLLALDANPEHLWLFQPHPNIVRMLGDICGLPFADKSFDIVFCISTLEHLDGFYRGRALFEVARVCRHHLVLTFDELNLDDAVHHLTDYGFNCGLKHNQPGEPLTTENGRPVQYLVGERL